MVQFGRAEDALELLDQQFRQTPRDVELLATLGEVALAVGDLDRAQKAYRVLAMLQLDDSSPITKAQAFVKLAEISLGVGDQRKARVFAEKARQADPALAEVPELLARIEGKDEGKDEGSGAAGSPDPPGVGGGGAPSFSDHPRRKKDSDFGVILALIAIVALVILGLVLLF